MDIRLYREGLAQLLGREEELSIAGAAANLEDALIAVRDLRPEVVLIDLTMPDSLAAVRAMRVIDPDLKVVALTVPEIEEDVVACVEAGVGGYVAREGGVAELVGAIQSVSRGEFLCSPRVAAVLRKRVTALAASVGLPGREP